MVKRRTSGYSMDDMTERKTRDLSGSTGLNNINEITKPEPKKESGQGRYDLIAMELIDLDLHQPRNVTKPTLAEAEMLKGKYADFKLYLTDDTAGFNPEDLKRSVPDRADILIRFLFFALDIEQAGLTHPINVYRAGKRYVIIQGERRYLAHLVIDKAHIPALERPLTHQTLPADALSYYVKQVNENIHREDFSVQEKLSIIRKAYALFQEAYQKTPSVRDLAALLRLSRGTVQRYLEVLNNPDAADLLLSDTSVKLTRVLAEKPAKVSAPETRGRKPKINLGKVDDLRLVHSLMMRLDAESVLSGTVDWHDPKAVQVAWQSLLLKLSKEL